MDKQWSVRLDEIKHLRIEAYKIDYGILAVILLGVGLSGLNPALSGFCGIFAFVLFYRKIVRAAHALCPRCGHRFGSGLKFPLGVGDRYCQHCGLHIEQNDQDLSH
jgi:hypothetical protein